MNSDLNWLHRCSSDNPLQTAVLNLFVTLKSRFPNLVVGSITRDSVKRALMNGITADQVGCFQYSRHEGQFSDGGVHTGLRSSVI